MPPIGLPNPPELDPKLLVEGAPNDEPPPKLFEAGVLPNAGVFPKLVDAVAVGVLPNAGVFPKLVDAVAVGVLPNAGTGVSGSGAIAVVAEVVSAGSNFGITFSFYPRPCIIVNSPFIHVFSVSLNAIWLASCIISNCLCISCNT